MEEVEHLGTLALNKLKKKIQCKIALLEQDSNNKNVVYDVILQRCTAYADVIQMIDYELEKLNNEQ